MNHPLDAAIWLPAAVAAQLCTSADPPATAEAAVRDYPHARAAIREIVLPHLAADSPARAALRGLPYVRGCVHAYNT